ncbi:protein translocase subunit SecA [Clostridium pasteurianum DSM 525 = ATCC 6013]|uniref:Protein translocase subunit SecA n=1 Tax=Clostridium pasteurianum DSM 525 = ATCC 6013 TaxID=1262449 RepID=A0A0H3J8P2_CLOPA|nr:preprotein translocase subunit SecA [Clostridium pasteurianum]AJA49597.1 protein translocase subunit SecA [Clostridium pasteurianum DSM 525 = ATCC 6013]AJA53585.1 protein translocase subunit SecA [Clostridium pasteurianum DSM 525 = ATCC 6013]AOZ76751.1 preprotein translocase subunit SecA [Clostridium pasteurianum DSM 525 = ATCC 6013]AOZ80548.1 preprotein translocase subunit SecA [Clostridium pasteurianum]ELP58887.1 preprotein translocase subunit SecA [Clostridium pasteurianum DSM 525 = ATCC
MGILGKIFGTYSEREVKRIIPIVNKVDSFDEKIASLSDDGLKSKTEEFKNRLNNGETLDDILPEAFAVVREASYRVLGMKHFREQVIGGIVLHQGRISEMKTGEGKTLVATLPSYLNALTGKGVHIVTVNDYLAKRDKEWMGKVYEFLGLTVGVILHNLNQDERKEAYAADITYGTNNEFGFDYLRDNMVIYKEERVQKPLNYAIVDEVDSILIDESRTPLIISGEGDKSTEFYKVADGFAKTLIKEDYTVDEKSNSVMLTDSGVEKAEKFFNLENYADPDNMEIQHHLAQALKANYMMKKDKDYMVKDGEVIIVDEFTGRLMEGRRYSDGLHQAIEAKELVKVQKESKTLATITFQNYFRLYNKLSGMTGTALTEEIEFREIYGLDVIVVPTHRGIARKDFPDLVYKTEKGKFDAIVEEIAETNKSAQPVLVGTVSIEKSEVLSMLLKRRGIKHQVLNAKYHEKEAEIISHAGEKGSITIATNMAGRGTDIKLGDGVVELGGLKIIGTERHESRRIDNQLRGRSGRQGDPGSSRFYVSLEDDLMRIFGSEKLSGIVDKLGLQDDEAIESKMVSNAIENAQKKVEGNNFDIRKTLLKYDDVMNQQREIMYKQRSQVLEGEDMKSQIQAMIKEVIYTAVDSHLTDLEENIEQDLEKLIEFLEDIYLPKNKITVDELKVLSDEEIKEKLLKIAMDIYDEKENSFGSEQMRDIERVILLRVVDTKWMDHIDNMDHLKQGMGLRAYRQQDPVQAYQFEGSQMFDEMVYNIKIETVKYLYRVQVERAPERLRVVRPTTTNHNEVEGVKEPIRRKEEKIGRNDPCPCGSGKKYKNCCGKRA